MPPNIRHGAYYSAPVGGHHGMQWDAHDGNLENDRHNHHHHHHHGGQQQKKKRGHHHHRRRRHHQQHHTPSSPPTPITRAIYLTTPPRSTTSSHRSSNNTPSDKVIAEGRRIYVGNIRYCLRPLQMHRFLKKLGLDVGIGKIYMPISNSDDRDGGPVNRGYCFVTYADAKEARRVMEALHHCMWKGRRLVCRPSLPRSVSTIPKFQYDDYDCDNFPPPSGMCPCCWPGHPPPAFPAPQAYGWGGGTPFNNGYDPIMQQDPFYNDRGGWPPYRPTMNLGAPFGCGEGYYYHNNVPFMGMAAGAPYPAPPSVTASSTVLSDGSSRKTSSGTASATALTGDVGPSAAAAPPSGDRHDDDTDQNTHDGNSGHDNDNDNHDNATTNGNQEEAGNSEEHHHHHHQPPAPTTPPQIHGHKAHCIPSPDHFTRYAAESGQNNPPYQPPRDSFAAHARTIEITNLPPLRSHRVCDAEMRAIFHRYTVTGVSIATPQVQETYPYQCSAFEHQCDPYCCYVQFATADEAKDAARYVRSKLFLHGGSLRRLPVDRYWKLD